MEKQTSEEQKNQRLEQLKPWQRDFVNPKFTGRRLVSEGLGTFLLVLVAAGGEIVYTLSNGQIIKSAIVIAPGLMVMAIILFMGKISGAHLNPVVTVAFAARGDFPWRRVPMYIFAQFVGASVASLSLLIVFGLVGNMGGTEPGPMFSVWQALVIEVLTTFGLVSVILGTASKAQNVGYFSAIAVGGYIALAGIWAYPVSHVSMNPARSFGPDLMLLNFGTYWLYVVGPLIGALLAVGFAYILRGPGGSKEAVTAAQGAAILDI